MPIMFADLSQLVVMGQNSFMDAFVSSGLVGDDSEELTFRGNVYIHMVWCAR